MTNEIFVSPIRLVHEVYIIGGNQIRVYDIKEIFFDKRGGGFRIEIGSYRFEDLGEIVFRTRAEAEKKRDEVWKE